MTRRVLSSIVVLVGLVFAIAPAATLASHVLPPKAEISFKEFIRSVNAEGALGSGIEVTGVGIEGDRATVDLLGPAGAIRVLLTHPSQCEPLAPCASWFRVDIVAGAGVPLQNLVETLDNAFPTDPWTLAVGAGQNAVETSFAMMATGMSLVLLLAVVFLIATVSELRG
jgi:hypothetical protein